MKVLLIYPNRGPRGNTPIGLAMVSGVLKREGHNVELFDTTFYKQAGGTEKEFGERILDYKKVDLSKVGVFQERVNIKKRFEEKVERFKPDLIAFSFLSSQLIGEDEYNMCAQGINLLKECEIDKEIPVLVGGLHPTVAPEEVLKEGCVDMVCLGEGEEAIAEVARKIEKGRSVKKVKNLWVKENGKIWKNKLRPLIQNLDDLPFLDFSIFDKRTFFRPYEGEVVKGFDFEMSRGCLHSCSYCLTPFLKNLYARQKYRREKSVDRIINEIAFLKDKHGLNFMKLHDENFLLMKKEKLEKLAQRFKEEVGIRFVIETRPEAVTNEKAEFLKKMGCVSASVGIECGNEEYRKRVLNRHMTNEQIIKGIRILKKKGIRTRAFNMLGLPYETRELIFETIRLNKDAKVDSASASFFSPFKGTRLRDVCLREGFAGKGDKLEFIRKGSNLEMPHLARKELQGLMKTFVMYLNSPGFMYPAVRLCEGDGFFSKNLFGFLSLIYYQRIHGFLRK